MLLLSLVCWGYRCVPLWFLPDGAGDGTQGLVHTQTTELHSSHALYYYCFVMPALGT